MRFITLYDESGSAHDVNPDHVVSLSRSYAFTVVHLSDGRTLQTGKSLDGVKALINPPATESDVTYRFDAVDASEAVRKAQRA